MDTPETFSGSGPQSVRARAGLIGTGPLKRKTRTLKKIGPLEAHHQIGGRHGD